MRIYISLIFEMEFEFFYLIWIKKIWILIIKFLNDGNYGKLY